MNTKPAFSAASQSEALARAISEWSNVVGSDRVATDNAALHRFSIACEYKESKPVAVVRPSNVRQVQDILVIASRNGVPVYPISRGRNWGYSSATPLTEDNVILDLGDLNRILEVNTELAYAVVEPGVTQQQLYEHLRDNNVPLILDANGAAPDASFIGNIAERGFAQSSYGDRFAHCCGMEVVLPTGELVNTGFGHYPGSKAQYLYKWGIGPSLDGIFTQSNFGIITKVAIWLMPRHNGGGVCRIHISDDTRLAECVEKLRDLKLRGVLNTALHIINDIRLISSLQQYPYGTTGGRTPLSDLEVEVLRKQWNVSAWQAIGGMWGASQDVDFRVKEIKRSLRGLAKIDFISRSRMKILNKLMAVVPGIVPQNIKGLSGIFEIMQGRPSTTPMKATYWRKKQQISRDHYDPAADRCGIVWCSPIIPLTAYDTKNFCEIMRSTMREFSMDSTVTLSLLNERSGCCTTGIVFDRDQPGDDDRAAACHTALLKRFATAGYYPYRVGVIEPSGRDLVFNGADPFWKLCGQIKSAIDPQHILAPGRYEPV